MKSEEGADADRLNDGRVSHASLAPSVSYII